MKEVELQGLYFWSRRGRWRCHQSENGFRENVMNDVIDAFSPGDQMMGQDNVSNEDSQEDGG